MLLKVSLMGLWKPWPLGKMRANTYGFGRVSNHLLFLYSNNLIFHTFNTVSAGIIQLLHCAFPSCLQNVLWFFWNKVLFWFLTYMEAVLLLSLSTLQDFLPVLPWLFLFYLCEGFACMHIFVPLEPGVCEGQEKGLVQMVVSCHAVNFPWVLWTNRTASISHWDISLGLNN